MRGERTMTKILIIDDNPDLCTLVRTILERDGYQVESAYNGQSGLEQAASLQPDLILLDVMMPGVDGWEICQQLRKSSKAPIIFVSAKGSESDIVRGLRLGADDYIPKPFRRHELVARIEAVLRRSQRDKSVGDMVYEVGDLIINQTLWEVHREGKPVHLTPTEFKLLLLFAQHGGRPVTHKEILATVWGAKQENNLNLLKVYIRQLRKKVEPDPDRPRYILTKRGVGYRLAF